MPKRKKKDWHRKQTDKRLLRQKAYHSPEWKKVRDHYIMNHPMCEECGCRPAVDVHHKKSPFEGESTDYELFLNESNLMALCKQCHGNHHSGRKRIITDTEEEDLELDFTII